MKKELQSRIRAHLIQKKQRDDLDRQNRELRNNMEKLNYMPTGTGLRAVVTGVCDGRSDGGYAFLRSG